MQDAISSPAASATHPAPRSRAMSPPPPFAPVDIQGLRKRYGDNEVLKGIDLRIGRREVVTIIGRSGSGKSTLLRCVNGLEAFQQGGLAVDGQPLRHDDAKAMRALRQNVGMIFQNFNLFPTSAPAAT